MPSPLTQAGALSEQSKYAPLHTNEFFTGLWTQRNPLRDAAVPYLYGKYYGASRFDSIIRGVNIEISSRLTPIGRPGLSVYNSQIFPAINRFYEFRTFSAVSEAIRIMADCAGNVYDATGPNTKNSIMAKSAGSGSTFFQSVGNSLYMGNGVDKKKWVQSAKTWLANHTFASTDFIVDTANNLQVAMGARSAAISSTSLTANVVTMTFKGRVALLFYVGMKVLLSGLTTAAGLNGATVTILSVSYNQITFAFVSGNYANTPDTGTAACAGGNTGGAQPAWGAVKGNITADGAQQWLCAGNSVQEWGIDAPTAAPTTVNGPRPSIYNRWTANTIYSSSLSIIDPNGNVQKLTTGGTTGGAQPVWSLILGGVTADNTAAWTNMGSAAWVAGHAYALGDLIQVTWSYWVTVPAPPCFSPNVKVDTCNGPVEFGKMPQQLVVMTEFGPMMADVLSHEFDGIMIDMGDGELVTFDHLLKRGDKYIAAKDALPDNPRVPYKGLVYNLSIHTNDEAQRHYVLANGEVAHNRKADPDPDNPDPGDSYEVTVTAVWQCVTAGITGGVQPAWYDGLGVTVADNTVVWQNIGAGGTWLLNIGAGQKVSLDQTVIDSNGSLQRISLSGKSAAVEPTWSTVLGATTVDNAATWINAGPFAGANTGAWIHSFAYKNSITGGVSSESPVSNPLTLAADSIAVVQGAASTDPQVDVIQIFRTAQGGSTRLLLDEIQNPGTGTWLYNDSTTDSGLSVTTQAPTGSANNPPPVGIVRLNYHLGRVWGVVGNTLYYSSGPDVINGNGNEGFAPLNSFIYPSAITRTWSTSIGLLVHTVSDVYIVLGKGTSTSTFYTVMFLEGVGLLSYDAFSVHGSTAYLMTSAKKVIALDPGAGVTEVGFPIGDQFTSLYSASTAFVTWHEGESGDTALYVGDAATGWFRMSPTSAPETGTIWSPRAAVTGGCKAVQSLEVTPGTCTLLVGPGAGTGPIEQRDLTMTSDNGTPFAQWFDIGSITLAQPGQVADIDFITVDSLRTGKRVKVGVLLGEVNGTFENIRRVRQDPPLLPPSKTTYNDRYPLSTNQTPTLCRHFQIRFTFPTENAAHELLAYTIFGAVQQERRSQ
jgi:hypothetical protein